MLNKKGELKIIICLGINILMAAVAIFIFGTTYYLNDDLGIGYTCFGIATEPTSRVYYTNVILGWLYKNLFELLPIINWQTLSYYVVLIFSGTVGLYSVIDTKKKNYIILWSLFELVFFHDAYVYLTFSVVAAFVGCRGYISFFLTAKENKNSLWMYILSGISIICSSMIRMDSFFAVSGFAFLTWGILTFVNLSGKRGINREIIKTFVYPFTVIIGICFLLYGIDRFTYSKGDWHAYKEHEDTLSIITDNRTAINVLGYSAFEDEGISESVVKAISDWRNNDPEVIDIELLTKISDTSKKYNYLTSPYVWNDFGKQCKVIFSKYVEAYFLVILVAFLVFAIKKKWVPILLLIPFWIEFFYFAYVGRIEGGEYPERCVCTVLMGASMGALSLYISMEKSGLKKPQQIVFLCLLVAISIAVQPSKDYAVKGLGLVDTDSIEKEFKFLGRGEKIYVCETAVSAAVDEAYGAWQVPPAGLLRNSVSIGSWLIGHPSQTEKQARLGCENPYRALFEKDNVYYIRLNNSEDDILEYLRENYDQRIEVEYVKKKGNFKVFQYHLK